MSDEDTPLARFTGALQAITSLSIQDGADPRQVAVTLAAQLSILLGGMAATRVDLDKTLAIILPAIETDAKARFMALQANAKGGRA